MKVSLPDGWKIETDKSKFPDDMLVNKYLGYARGRTKTIYIYDFIKKYIPFVLDHEITHGIQYETGGVMYHCPNPCIMTKRSVSNWKWYITPFAMLFRWDKHCKDCREEIDMYKLKIKGGQ